MLFKIIIDTLRAFIAGLVLSLACCCMMIAQAFVKAAVCLARFACKVNGVKCDVK
nr:MAG TPA: hypothetical protein [Caudoviricetes sp.]